MLYFIIFPSPNRNFYVLSRFHKQKSVGWDLCRFFSPGVYKLFFSNFHTQCFRSTDLCVLLLLDNYIFRKPTSCLFLPLPVHTFSTQRFKTCLKILLHQVPQISRSCRRTADILSHSLEPCISNLNPLCLVFSWIRNLNARAKTKEMCIIEFDRDPHWLAQHALTYHAHSSCSCPAVVLGICKNTRFQDQLVVMLSAQPADQLALRKHCIIRLSCPPDSDQTHFLRNVWTLNAVPLANGWINQHMLNNTEPLTAQTILAITNNRLSCKHCLQQQFEVWQ